jgi:hypothetical protein
MDDPYVGSNAMLRLQRACERNRLEKELLIDAYEYLVVLVVPEEDRSIGDCIVTEQEWNRKHTDASETCGIGND